MIAERLVSVLRRPQRSLGLAEHEPLSVPVGQVGLGHQHDSGRLIPPVHAAFHVDQIDLRFPKGADIGVLCQERRNNVSVRRDLVIGQRGGDDARLARGAAGVRQLQPSVHSHAAQLPVAAGRLAGEMQRALHQRPRGTSLIDLELGG